MSQERSPLGEFEIRGEWWLPGNPDNRVPGMVYYKAGERVRLDFSKAIAAVDEYGGLKLDCQSF